MMPVVRAPSKALAIAIMSCIAANAQTGETPTLQKCPISLPDAIVPATLPIQMWGRVPTVIVSLNDSRVERAAIATGVNANVISPDASQRLKLGTVDGRVKIDALDSTTAGGQAEVKRFRAATLDLANLSFAVADVPGSRGDPEVA